MFRILSANVDQTEEAETTTNNRPQTAINK